MKKFFFLLPAILLFAGCSITKEPEVVTYDVCTLNGGLSSCDVSGAIVVQHCTSNDCVAITPIPTVEEVLALEIVAIAEGTISGNMVYVGDIWVEKGPTTGGISVDFPQQPKLLPGNYQENTQFLINRELKNTVELAIPADAKNVMITVKLHKLSAYVNIPGNIQFSVDGKNFTNGRLVGNSTLTYPIEKITTQDKPQGANLSSAIGKTLKIRGFMGESNNRIEAIEASRDL